MDLSATEVGLVSVREIRGRGMSECDGDKREGMRECDGERDE